MLVVHNKVYISIDNLDWYLWKNHVSKF